MEQFMQFVRNHWLLWSALAVALLAIIFEESRRLRYTQGLSPQQLTMMLNHHEAVAIDVRDAQAYQKGHILSAVNMPANDKLDTLMTQKLQAYKNKLIVLVDENGSSAFKILIALRKEGFEKINVLSGGIAAWKEAGLPLA